MHTLPAGSQPSLRHIHSRPPVVSWQIDGRLSASPLSRQAGRCPDNAVCVRASTSGNGADNGENGSGDRKDAARPQYRYNSGDGRPKASMEDADWTRASGPWQVSWQMNERNLVWTDDLKSRLLKVICFCWMPQELPGSSLSRFARAILKQFALERLSFGSFSFAAQRGIICNGHARISQVVFGVL